MSLAEQIGRDVRSVFLNENDFARPVQWDGRDVLAVEDKDALAELKAKREDLRAASVLLHLAAEDVGDVPAAGAYVTYEGRRYRVTEVTDGDGMYSITLSEVRR